MWHIYRPRTPTAGQDSTVDTGPATGWKIRGSNPGRKKRLSLLHTCPEAKPAMRTWASCQGVKRPGRGVGYRPPSTAELNNDRSQHLQYLFAWVAYDGQTFALNTRTEIMHLLRSKIGWNASCFTNICSVGRKQHQAGLVLNITVFCKVTPCTLVDKGRFQPIRCYILRRPEYRL
jgi:hypothetical protein